MSSDTTQKQLMANALTALKKSQAKVKSLQQAKKQPIAIIGMACRLPGDINDLTSLNQQLSQGINGVTEVPASRWDSNVYFSDDKQAPGKMITNQGGFISGGDKFDSLFFKVSHRKAKYLDPQHRLLMTHVWHALENANIVPNDLYQQEVGTFIGISSLDYAQVITANSDDNQFNGDITAGNMHSMAVGRIASYFGFTGPAIPVDTACSSSLVAVHQACESLRNQSCSLALAGGVNAIYNPLVSVEFSKAQMLAPDGRCKTFDQNADGYVRGEGVGVIVLKRLDDAKKDNDNILAIIRGSATNHNGPSGGLTVPSGAAQQQVIEQALKNASAKPDDIDCIEAHGTGTSLGDPIELRALNQVFATDTRQTPLWLSSIKTNIGHLEAAAGIASIIKMMAQLQQQTVYQHLNFNQATSHFDWQNSPLKVPTQKVDWSQANQAKSAERIGGISSYGINGSNAHVILSQAPIAEISTIDDAPNKERQPSVNVLTLSAKSAYSLQQLIKKYSEFLNTNPHYDIADVCYTTNISRSHFAYRFAAIASDKLESILEQASDLNFSPVTSPTLNFVVTGNCENIDQSYTQLPTFKQHFSQCIALDYDNAIACEYALVKTLQSWGLTFDSIIGVGKGEIIAACINEQITLTQGVTALKRFIATTISTPNGNPKANANASQAINDKLTDTANAVVISADAQLSLNLDATPIIRLSTAAQDLAKFYSQGIDINWQAIGQEQSFNKVQLPKYQFEEQRFWIETKSRKAQQSAIENDTQHGKQLSNNNLLTDELMDDVIGDLICSKSTAFGSTENSSYENNSDENAANENSSAEQNELAQLEAYLSRMIGDALQMPASKIDRQTALDNYGIDSIVISQLFGQLQQHFADITANIFFDYDRVETIAEYLYGQYPSDVSRILSARPSADNQNTPIQQLQEHKESFDKRAVVCLNPCDNPTARLLVFHPFGFGYHSIEWMKKLGKGNEEKSQIEVWAVGAEKHTNWQDLVKHLADEMKHLFDKPIIAWGHSMGAPVAFETLAYLQHQHNLHTQHLVVSSSSLTLFERMKYSDPFYQIDANTPTQSIIDDLVKGHILPPKDLIRSLAPSTVLNDLALCKTYQRDKELRLDSNITLVQANNDILLPDASVMLDWQQVVTGECHYQEIDGNHMFFARPPKAFIQLLKSHCASFSANTVKAGVYQLTDLVAGTNDLHLTPFSRKPAGVLIYDDDGNSAAHLWHPKRPKNCFGPPFNSERYLTYIAYGGKYQQHAGVVQHHIATCLIPNWDGKTLWRSIEQDKPPGKGFNLSTGPVINQQEHQYGFENHQRLSWQPMELQVLPELSDYKGAWVLDSITGGDDLLNANAYNGRCLITAQGVISVLINPKTRTQLPAQNLYYVTDAQIDTVLSQSIHLLLAVNNLTEAHNHASVQCDVLVSQTSQTIDGQSLSIEYQDKNLVLSWPLENGGKLSAVWCRD